MTEYTIRVWARLPGSPAKCDRCRRPIVFRYKTNGKQVPINPGALVLHTEIDEASQRPIAVYARDDLHFTTCPARRVETRGFTT